MSARHKSSKKQRSRVLDAATYAVARALLFGLAWLPEFVVYPALDALGRLYLRCSKKRRKIAVANLALAFEGKRSEAELFALARRACGASFMVLGDVARIERMIRSGKHRDRVDDRAFLDQLERRRAELGLVSAPIFCTPHLGSWEVAGFQLGLHFDGAVVIARPLGNPYLQAWLVRCRSQLGVSIVPRRGGVRSLVAALRANCAIGLLPDQNQRTRGIFVEVFGKLASCDRSPARLAQMSAASIVAMACYRVGRRYRFRLELGDIFGVEAGTKDLAVPTRRLQASIEELILRAPEQYFWVHDRYRTRPSQQPDAPSLASAEPARRQ